MWPAVPARVWPRRQPRPAHLDDAAAVDLLEELISTPSVSGEEALAVSLLVRRMRELGLNAHVDEAGNAVGSIGTGGPHLVLLGHIDTVPGVVPVRREDGRLFRVWGDVAWLGSDRLVFWENELSQPVVWDVGKRELRVLEGISGPAEFTFTKDGRTMTINYAAEESDIWLLTLAE